MPPRALYRTEAACQRCAGPLPPGSSVNRRWCPACGHVRRALTFLRQARSELDRSDATGVDVATHHASQAIEVLEP